MTASYVGLPGRTLGYTAKWRVTPVSRHRHSLRPVPASGAAVAGPVPFAVMAEPRRRAQSPPGRHAPAPLHGRARRARSRPAWQDRWEREGTFLTPNPVGDLSAGFDKVADRPKLYVLDMFPYPSGAGLHVGHPLGYIGTDVYARYQRMTRPQRRAHHGLRRLRPARRAVRGADRPAPARRPPRPTSPPCGASCGAWAWPTTRAGRSPPSTRATTGGPSGSSCRSSTPGTTPTPTGPGPSTTWSPSSTPAPASRARAPTRTGARGPSCRPTERRVVVDNHRLAYVNEAPVNWCPGLGTVLANEEVTADGRSERGNFPVFKRPLKQWMMRITAYADRLIGDLDAARLARGHQAACSATGSAGPRARASRSPPPRRRPQAGDRGLHHPARHRCSAPPTWCWRPSTRWSTS